MKLVISSFFFLVSFVVSSQEIAVLKYKGGGDWYGNPTSLPNLIAFCNANINTKIKETLNFNSPYFQLDVKG